MLSRVQLFCNPCPVARQAPGSQPRDRIYIFTTEPPGKPSKVTVLCYAVLSGFSHVWLCATLWTVAHQAPLSMGFSRQEYWSGLPCPPPGHLPDPGIETESLTSPALAAWFFTTSVAWEASKGTIFRQKNDSNGGNIWLWRNTFSSPSLRFQYTAFRHCGDWPSY